MRGIELLLRKLRDQQAQAIKLHRGDEAPEDAVKVVGAHHFTLRDIYQLRMRRQKYRRRKFRQEAVGEVELHVDPVQPRELLDLDLRKDHPSDFMLDMRKSVKPRGKHLLALDVLGLHLAEFVPGDAVLEVRGGADRLVLPF